MSNPIVISGSLVDVRNVASHKCARLVIDVPAEMAAQIIAAFGWPTMVDPVPVAVARLNADPVAQRIERPAPDREAAGSSPAGVAKRSWGELPLSQQAAIRCGEQAFWRFLDERVNGVAPIDSADAAADFVRQHCQVRSRAHIDAGKASGRLWRELDAEFQTWKHHPELVA